MIRADPRGISISRYRMHPQVAVNAKHDGSAVDGALMRVDGGFACLQPWPSLGDAPLALHLAELAAGQATPLAAAALACAREDGGARAAGRSLFAGLRVPPSHVTLAGRPDRAALAVAAAGPTGHVKIKAGPAWRDAIGDWQAAAASCPQLRLRLDFNSTLAPHEFRAFAAAIGPELRATIDFIEDPCPFDPQLWHGLQHATGLQLAVDRGSDLPGAANFLGVVKPAVEDAASQIAAAARSGRRLVITSNMDHPLGQLWAALHAARAACAGVLHGPCGLLTHGLFEPLPDFPSPRATNGVLEIPPGPGLGYDREWSALEWEPLR
jgi:o-succinylbenzoate synthase